MKKILIVEDDSSLRELYKHTFSSANYQVDDVHDTTSALKKLRETEYDIILLDLLFPGMNGVQLIKSLRSSNSLNHDTPIVILSNVSGDQKVIEALNAGANKYLFKVQNTPKSIMNEVEQVLGNNKQG